MRFEYFGLLLLAIFLIPVCYARQPKLTPDQIAHNYDFNNPQDRYRWYQDARIYISQHGHLHCKPGTILEIKKDGTFSVNVAVISQPRLLQFVTSGSDVQCVMSVKSKKFPLPYNFTGESASFRVRDENEMPLSNDELDNEVFKLPFARPAIPATGVTGASPIQNQ